MDTVLEVLQWTEHFFVVEKCLECLEIYFLSLRLYLKPERSISTVHQAKSYVEIFDILQTTDIMLP